MTKKETKVDSDKKEPIATEKDPEIEEAVGKILNNLINATEKTLVNSLKLIGNPDGPGAPAPDLSPV